MRATDPMSTPAAIRRRINKWFAPPVPAAFREADIVVGECNAWTGYILPTMYPGATRIPVRPGQSGARFLQDLPRNTRLLVLQIDASTTTTFWSDTPPTSALLAERGIVAVNVDARDIRKRTVHQHAAKLGVPSAAATRDGPSDERVIIKTTLNAGGAPERKLLRQWGDSSTRLGTDISTTIRGPLDYRVCLRGEVPDNVWVDPTLVVERFIENPEGLFMRVYIFGPASVVSIVWTDATIKKLSLPFAARRDYFGWTTVDGYVPLGQPGALARRAMEVVRPLSRSLGLEVCGVDCMVAASGEVIPVDVNKTPYWGKTPRSPILAHLRHGAEYLLPPDAFDR